MLRTNVYLTEELKRQIDQTARVQGKSKAAVIRAVLDAGMKTVKPQKSGSAKALLEIAEMAKKFKGTGPRDLSINHDHYIWGGPKRDPKAAV